MLFVMSIYQYRVSKREPWRVQKRTLKLHKTRVEPETHFGRPWGSPGGHFGSILGSIWDPFWTPFEGHFHYAPAAGVNL